MAALDWRLVLSAFVGAFVGGSLARAVILFIDLWEKDHEA